MESTMRELLSSSRQMFLAEVKEFGEEEAFRRRFRAMASDGDLCAIEMAVNESCRFLSNLFLTSLEAKDVDIVRGQIIGLRHFWRDLLNAGEVSQDDKRVSLESDEMNPFANLSREDDNPLEML
jgi:hypothetical protein